MQISGLVFARPLGTNLLIKIKNLIRKSIDKLRFSNRMYLSAGGARDSWHWL
jgi:prolyl-tRNA synthetase